MKKTTLKTLIAVFLSTLCSISVIACGIIKDSASVENAQISFIVDNEVYATIKNTDDTVTLPDTPAKIGYEFLGWYMDNNVWQKPFTNESLTKTDISKNISVYAKFNAIAYSIEYNTIGGTHENPVKYTIEDKIILTDAQKLGYKFEGWFTDNTYENKITSIENSTGNLTLYAKFDINTYSIKYSNLKGASNNNPTSYTVESEDIILTPLKLSGYIFDGWYNEGVKITKITKDNIGDLTLTAKWSMINYGISYHNVNDSENPNQTTYTVAELPLTLKNAVRSGYTFQGWFTDLNYITEVSSIKLFPQNIFLRRFLILD